MKLLHHSRTPRWPAAALLIGSLVLLSPVCACQAPPTRTGAPRADLTLEQRAVDLLLRAARSEDPELASNAIEALVEVAPEQGLPFFRAALAAESPLARFAGLVALGTLRECAAPGGYRAHLADASPMVQLAAAYVLCRCGDSTQAAVLVNALNGHPDENVRAEAAHLVGLLDEPRAIKRLRYAARIRANERAPKVLVQIYTALARLGDAEAVRRLIDYTQGTSAMRLLALQGLAEVGPEEARSALRYRAGPDEDYLVHRLIAARGLAKLGSNVGYDLALRSTRFVGKNLEDPAETMRVRANAALTLGEIGDRRALPALERLAADGQDARVQVAACYAICRIVQR